MPKSGSAKYNFIRYPKTKHRSLQAWNASDEHILRYLDSNLIFNQPSLAIYNDRFGYLTCYLHNLIPRVVINYSSQKKAILHNLEINQLLSNNKIKFVEPINKSLKLIDLAIIKIPKSMDLFRLQLIDITKSLDENGIVLCGFMTRHFTKQMITIADEFFEDIEQSLAWKKSRVLVLRKAKPIKEQSIINTISFEDQTFKQYFGVFSARHIDDASQFLVKNWKIDEDAERVLDLASGNGFLAKMIRLRNEDCEIHLLDDDWLAVESSKLNFDNKSKNTFFHFDDTPDSLEDDFFDLVVCNPPFHFEFETNIEVAINLFQEVKRCLKKDGNFELVSNCHLNYKTHLSKLFTNVQILKRNKKFEVYICSL